MVHKACVGVCNDEKIFLKQIDEHPIDEVAF